MQDCRRHRAWTYRLNQNMYHTKGMNKMYDLVERIFISYICDLLRPHPKGEVIRQYFEKKVYKNKSGKTKTKVYPRWTNHKLQSQARKFFNVKNPHFTELCDICNIEYADILKITDFCIANDEDRLFGKRAIRAYFKAKRTQND